MRSYRSDTIATMIRKRVNQTHFLPAIQREFVWGPQQISTLFDSLMREYPVGSFLFWELEPKNNDEWESYEFILSASQRVSHNELANTDIVQNLTLVLDGQQRLTALNIGLRGFYETKKPRAHYNSPWAWQKRRLYLDLLQDSQTQEEGGEEGMRYGFSFLIDERDSFTSGGRLWFRVGRILRTTNTDELEDLIEQELENLPEDVPGDEARKRRKIIRHNLTRLFEVVWKDTAIWYYTEDRQDYDRVLDIFVRANSGGTVLSKSDLLLSTITARWKDVNARQEIYGFVDRINGDLSRSNNFNKDFVMKTCLVLCDLPVRYRVQNFNNKNLTLIFSNWEIIKKAVESGVRLANNFGLDRNTLLSHNALIPVIYYLYSLDTDTSFLGTTQFEGINAAAIRKWLTAALLNNTFGGASDTVLTETRRVIREELANGERNFPIESLNRRIVAIGRSTELNNEVIEEILSMPYGNRRTFLALSLLYDRRDFGITEFHQDHIFPRAFFTDERLEKADIPAEKWERYRELCNQLGNLELLMQHENQEKSAKDFPEWLKTRNADFKREHLIPEDDEALSFEDFEEFVVAREELIRSRLRKLFQTENEKTEYES